MKYLFWRSINVMFYFYVLSILISFNRGYQLKHNSANILSLTFPQVSELLGGTGRARTFWNYIKNGEHPLLAPITQAWSEKSRMSLLEYLENKPLISTSVSSETLSPCGTRKFLQTLSDFQSIESVLIPSVKFDRTTLCVSTQIGCDRGCAFCLTGTMGLIRNLTADEIISQVFQGMAISVRENMPPLRNVVFMGMGDSARNMDEVGKAVRCLADRDRFSMAQSKITISTVGPSPEAFRTLAQMPGSLAWSLHSADNNIRKKLVPSTKHTTIELREGFISALASRPSLHARTVMIALTLINGINDSLNDAAKLAEFIQPIYEVAPKIMIDLIPYNDHHENPEFTRPSREKVNEFQHYLRQKGIYCSVRVTRGDEEFSACGMLVTKRQKLNIVL